MSLILFTRALELPENVADFSNLAARIKESGTNTPAIVYSQTGSVVNRFGEVTLLDDGELSAYVEEGALFAVDVFDRRTGFVYYTLQQIDPLNQGGSSEITELYQEALDDGLVVSPAKDFETQVSSRQVTVSDLTLKYPTTYTPLASRVDWGDGTVESLATDLRTGDASHTYASNGDYEIAVSARIGALIGQAVTKPVTVTQSGNSGGGDGSLELAIGHYTNGNYVEWYMVSGDAIIAGSELDFGQGDIITLTDSPDSYPDEYLRAYELGQTYTITFTEFDGGVPTGRGGSITFTAFENLDDFGEFTETTSFDTSNTPREGLPVTFFNTSQRPGYDINTILWDFGDGTTSTQLSPSKTYATPGTYSVTMTLNGGDAVATQDVLVTQDYALSNTILAEDTFTAANDSPIEGRALETQLADQFETWDVIGTATDLSIQNNRAVTTVPSTTFRVEAYQDPNPVTVQPPFTDWQLKATLVPTGGANPFTINIYNNSPGPDVALSGQIASLSAASLSGTSIDVYSLSLFGEGQPSARIELTAQLNVPLEIEIGNIDNIYYVKISDGTTEAYRAVERTPTGVGKPNGLNFALGSFALDDISLREFEIA